MEQTASLDQRVSFDIIRYASCWEDTDVLLNALAIQEGQRCLSIASAGDNSLALLTAHPSLVVATDLSYAQIACLELRKAAFAGLSYEEMLAFLGFRDASGTRVETYTALRHQLSPIAETFWNERPEIIEQGIIHAGKFERYLRFFGRRILRLIHSKKIIQALLTERQEADRHAFYDRRWNTWRWRLLFKVFFSRQLLGRGGRDPEFLRHVEGGVANRILERSEYGLTALSTHDNPYLTYILTGQYGKILPFYARPENFDLIRHNLDRLIPYQGTTDQAIAAFGTRFDAFNLSDIFEYMDESQFHATSESLLSAATPGARLAYWNMLVPRKLAGHFPERVRALSERSQALFKQDRAFFYQSFHLDQVVQ